MPAVTSTCSTSGTWLTDVPRSWRTFGDAVHAVDVGLAELTTVVRASEEGSAELWLRSWRRCVDVQQLQGLRRPSLPTCRM